MRIKLNGDPYDLAEPVTVGELLARLGIDGRRVAVELNLVILKRGVFEQTTIKEGDEVEIVNFVGGGSG
jgi:thiamine biosynthesis protein ThiS